MAEMNSTEEKTISDQQFKRALLTAKLMKIIRELDYQELENLIKNVETQILEKKRKHPRKECQIEVDYMTKDRVYRDIIQSISANGLFIETSEQFEVGQNLKVILKLPNNQRPLKIECEVARITTDGAGVKFLNLTPYFEEILSALVKEV